MDSNCSTTQRTYRSSKNAAGFPTWMRASEEVLMAPETALLKLLSGTPCIGGPEPHMTYIHPGVSSSVLCCADVSAVGCVM